MADGESAMSEYARPLAKVSQSNRTVQGAMNTIWSQETQVVRINAGASVDPTLCCPRRNGDPRRDERPDLVQVAGIWKFPALTS
jgi:hypothetical protein